MYYIDPLPKAIIAAIFPQYQCDKGAGPGPGPCPYIYLDNHPVTYSDYLSNSFDAGHHDYWKWIGYLILTVAVFRILIALCLRYISHIRR